MAENNTTSQKKNYQELSTNVRQETGGQIFTGLKAQLKNKDDLSTFYSPGIAGPCMEINKHPEKAFDLTIKNNTIAVISDGSAVLGLGNIGPEAGLPVMEGKCMLFKQFGGVDAIPIVLDTQDVDEIVETIIRIAPTFGGINMEDISAPRCFEIEARLTEKLNIPVFHDDQHGTAICVLSGLINALKVVGKEKEDIHIIISGAGAAGIAILELLKVWGATNIHLVDSKGVVSCSREDLNPAKRKYCSQKIEGDMAKAVENADVFIGVSKGDILTEEMVKSMKPDPIIFAMANPYPEIHPDLAKKCGVKIMGTGRSDFPNQINNVLVFPGFFKGLLRSRIPKVKPEMKLEAAIALANLVENPSVDKVIPSPFDDGVAEAIAQAVEKWK